MYARIIAVAAFLVLASAFAIDALTPQTLVIAILFDVPIVLAALTLSRRLTGVLVITALLCNVAAAYINAARDGRWDLIGIGDRALSMLSIVLVGLLSVIVQERAVRVGTLASQEARARRRAVFSAASERTRASLSYDLVTRALVREATPLFSASVAWWHPYPDGEVLRASSALPQSVEVIDARTSPQIRSLLERVAGDDVVVTIRSIDPLGRFILDQLQTQAAIAIPAGERNTSFGVILLGLTDEQIDEMLLVEAREFGTLCVNVLAQARLFAELSARNEALAGRQAVIRELVAAISHDVRTPLSALSVTLKQAAAGSYGDISESYRGVISDSLIAIADLQRLAETLLLVARFEAGEFTPVHERVDLTQLAKELLSEFGPSAATSGITLLQTGPGSVTALAARSDIRRALSNLTANALRHTPLGGHVELQTSYDKGMAIVRVIDDGYGVDPSVRGRLFQRYVTDRPAGGGTGLGLHLAARIAEVFGGSIRYAERETRGSEFTLALPRWSNE